MRHWLLHSKETVSSRKDFRVKQNGNSMSHKMINRPKAGQIEKCDYGWSSAFWLSSIAFNRLVNSAIPAFRTLIIFVATIAAASPLVAQAPPDQKSGNSETSLSDPDFHIQGEYAGSMTLAGCCRPVGVQVVANGEGRFQAIIYRGGLPGNGFDGLVRYTLTGARSGEQVVLGGENLVILLQQGFAAVVRSAEGVRLGFLQPVKRLSARQGARPPSNSIVLFDGKNTDRLLNAKVTDDGLLEIGCETKEAYQNFTLHAEFRTPWLPLARGQNRGNSGFYLQKRYEVQVLDSFGLDPQFNDCGSLYKFKAPAVNMCFPPLRWQTYDIDFNAPQFSKDGQRTCKARITVRHNGVLIHNRLELDNKTGGGSIEGPNPLPILLQNHGNPVHFRNLWLIDHDRCDIRFSSHVEENSPDRTEPILRQTDFLRGQNMRRADG